MLSKEEIQRYSRHIKMAGVGMEGQERLKDARVLVIGAGGLGCPVLLYLTAAGVGTIGVIDHDTVDITNLQRQVLFTTEDVGRKKTEAAIDHLQQLNPFTVFHEYSERLTRENALELFSAYDIIVDGTDNFPTRYLVNDACVIANKPLVFGSIYQFEGQVSVFNYKGGPSYRCLYPEAPGEGEVPNCSEIGVFGVLPGVIGTRMASECIKMILGYGEVLSGKLELMDISGSRTLQLAIQRNESNFKRTELERDYSEVCATDSEPSTREEWSPLELKNRMDRGEEFVLVDVREPFELEICRFEGSVSIPLGELGARAKEVDPEVVNVFICHHGVRSAAAIDYLASIGYKNLVNLTGGIHEWAQQIDPEMPQY